MMKKGSRKWVQWIKECDCVGTASGPRATYQQEATINRGYLVTVTLWPGPVCDVCNTPWLLKEERTDPA